jgi:hypothetical protein
MKAFFLALALLNAPADEQELMVYDLYDADPVLAIAVLDVADEIVSSKTSEAPINFEECVLRDPAYLRANITDTERGY